MFSQSNWYWQNPLPQGNQLFGLNVFDENNILCVNKINILKTSDSGKNWNICYTGFDEDNGSIFMHNKNTGLMCAGLNTLIKTTNGGVNWSYFTQVNEIKNPRLYFIDINTGFLLARNSQNDFQGTKLMRTSNGGMNWTTLISDTSFELYDIFFPDPLTGYCSGSRDFGFPIQRKFKFYKTVDGGLTWDSISNPVRFDGRSLFFTSRDTGYVGGSSLFKTNNGGLNWTLINNSTVTLGLQFINTQTGYAINNSQTVFKTVNGGVNWQGLPTHELISSFYFLNIDIAYSVGHGGIVLKTTDGGTNWQQKTSSVTYEDFYDIKFSDVNTGFAVGQYGTALKTTNGGSNWNLIQFYHWDDLTSIAYAGSQTWYIACFDPGRIYKTTNTGNSWDTLPVNLYGITKIEFLDELNGFGICKYNYFFKTTNGGQSWFVNDTLNGGQNWSMDFIDKNTGFTGGSITRRTTNGGLTFEVLPLGSNSDIQFLDYNTGYTATYDILGGVVLRTTNSGQNWQSTHLGIHPMNFLQFVSPQTGYALNGQQIFKTTDGGLSWGHFSSCSKNFLYEFHFVDSLTGYCAGYEGTIIKTTNGGGEPIGILSGSTEVINYYILSQNFPNPFNPSTIIKYDVPIFSHVSLNVYDILGREVKVLVNEVKTPGSYSVRFDGTNLPSGIYFYKLSASDGLNNFVITKKMMLIR